MRTSHLTPNRQLQSKPDVEKVRAEVVLGSPSANCSGVGICRVLAYGENTAITCPRVDTLISMTEEGKFRFEFQKAAMEGRYMRRHFRWLLFQVLEPSLVPHHLFHGLKIKQRTIRPGIYQVWETEDALIVDFQTH